MKCSAFRQSIELVAGQLLGNEAIERLVLVERGDDVVAIAPLAFAGDDERRVDVEADGVDVAGHVQPVTAPALAEVRRSQQSVDQPLEGVGTLVGDKGLHFLAGGRQAHKVEIGPADKRRTVGLGRKRQSLGRQPSQQKRVDRRAAASVGQARNRHGRQRAE